jgi:hypothetical protein
MAVSTISLLAAPLSALWLTIAIWLGRRQLQLAREAPE